MAKFVRGDVVVMPFPFSDLSSSKKRPALILADMEGDDYIMLQITSKATSDDYAIALTNSDFTSGTLHQDSNIRPNKIFTLDQKLIAYRIGHVSDQKLQGIIDCVTGIIKS